MRIDKGTVEKFLDVVMDGIVEVRIIKVPKMGTIFGYYTDTLKLISDIQRYNHNIYITLNPPIKALFARSANRLTPRPEKTTGDDEIASRRWLFIDIDSQRPSGISATDDEKFHAWELAKTIASFLRNKKWPEPIFCDSGNGYYLLYRIDLPNDSESTTLIKKVLAYLDLRFSNEGAEIDTSVYNAARLVRLIGTINRKGDNVPERPHRLTKILKIPGSIEVVPKEKLEELARRLPEPEQDTAPQHYTRGTFDVQAWLERHGLEIKRVKPYGGGTCYVLKTCPFNPEHTDNAAFAIQFGNGAIAAGCHHDSCTWTWHDLRKKYEPHYDEAKKSRQKDNNGEKAPEDDEQSTKQVQAQVLIDLAFAHGIELFHTPEGEPYASFRVNGHIETCQILKNNGKLRCWLRKLFSQEYQRPPGSQAVQDAIYMLETYAQLDGPEMPVFIRVAEFGGKIYVDLGDDEGRAVEISPAGWQVVKNPPVRFLRPKGMLPLPVPQSGNLDLLRKYINVGSEDDFLLVVSWLLAALRPTGPYPILILQGEPGCAKTTTARVLKSLVDPDSSDTLRPPRDERDLMIIAVNSWCLSFDNLSGVSPWLSDALCCLSTRGSFSTRKLYADDERVTLNAMRPTILNGIDAIATRSDLLDRAIVLDLPIIPEHKRQSERKFWSSFERDRPYILGALFDAVATGLRNLPDVSAQDLPRMGDFAEWILACKPAPQGDFMAAFYGNRGEAVQNTLEASLVAQGITRLLKEEESWQGTATELLNLLCSYMTEEERRRKSWPKAANVLSNQLKRIAPLLRQQGIEVEWDRLPGTRKRIIRLGMQKTVLTVPTVPADKKSSDIHGLQSEGKNWGSSQDRPNTPPGSSRPSGRDDNSSAGTMGGTIKQFCNYPKSLKWDDRDDRDDHILTKSIDKNEAHDDDDLLRGTSSGCDDGDDKCDGPVTMRQFCNYPKLLNCDDCDGRDGDLHTQSKDKKHNDDDWVEGYV
ncbi:MAG: hypothetical protein JRI45_11150 [Deltaproteobacteria bacterium]|nr:hypothetical protein [Deltaproteobacteria bacterium]MBW2068943.1 hypothetical protein [Deltaproteobacteria bacterium]